MDDHIVSDVSTFNPCILDHESIVFNVSLSKPTTVTRTIVYRSLAKIKHAVFNHDLSMSPLISSLPIGLVDLVATNNSELTQMLNTHAPLKTKTVVERENCEWFTSELGELKRCLRALERENKSTGLTIDKELYKAKSAEYEQCRETTKWLYYTNAVLDCNGKQGAIFSIINKLLHRSGSSRLPSYESSMELANNSALFFNAKIAKIHTHLENSVVAGEMRSETPM